MKGAPECMRISGFMQGINNPELTKRLNEHVPRTMEEMMIATTAFIRGEAAAANKKKGHMSWRPQDQSKKHTDKRPNFKGHSRDGRRANRFTPITRTPKDILAAEANKFQPPPPVVTPVGKRNGNKFFDFHNDKGHNTDECMQLKKQIEELVRAGKLSHLIKEIKQGREQPKTGRKEVAVKDKPTTIYMVRSWQRTVKQKITQSFEQGKGITFPPLANSHRTEGPLVIEAEVGRDTIHRMYIDGDATYSTKAWMNFMIVKLPSPYNGIIGRPGLKAIQAVPSTVHEMLKFLTEEWIVTIRSSLLIPAECVSVDTSSVTPREKKARPANLTVPLHPNFPDQEWWKDALPVRQKKRGQAPERTKAIQAEVKKLVEPGIMREVYYHDWLSNPVMCSPDDRTGDGTYASLLYKPCVTGPGTKLLTDEKAGVITGLCSKKASKIFLGTSYRGASVAETQEEPWTLFTDGSSYVDGSGAGLILTNPDGVEFTYALRFQFVASNNEAEYEALIVGTLLEDEKKARKLRLKTRQYELMEGILYKQSFLTPWLRCVGPLQAEYIMREIHKGSCSMHAGPRPLFGRDGESKVPDSRNGLLHEVDRSKSSVERANRSLGEGIKARLGEGNKNWVEELPHVLWAHRTMIKSSHGDTPFSLTYGTEAVIPVEIGMPTYRTAVVDMVNNDEELRLNLDLLEERRELAAMSEARSKSKMMKYYNSRVRGVAFKPGNFVYRSNDASHAVAGGKLGPKWEGPYEVTGALGNGAYKLRSMDGTTLPRTWNVTNLKRFYL
nr:reverse transcriptase domain-containing protein [Tanacetum cinerariifolium]